MFSKAVVLQNILRLFPFSIFICHGTSLHDFIFFFIAVFSFIVWFTLLDLKLLPFSALFSLSVLPGFISATISVFVVLLILFVIVKFRLVQFYLTLSSPVYFLLFLFAFCSCLLSATLIALCFHFLSSSFFLQLFVLLLFLLLAFYSFIQRCFGAVCFLFAFFFNLLSFSRFILLQSASLPLSDSILLYYTVSSSSPVLLQLVSSAGSYTASWLAEISGLARSAY